MSRFTLTVDEIITMAQNRVGGGPFEGESLENALKQLNLVIQDIANMDIPLSFIKEITVTVPAATRSYELPAEVTEVFSIIDETNPNTITTLNRQGMIEFQQKNNKVTSGDVSTFAVHSTKMGTTLLLWPIPSRDTTLRMYVQISPPEITSYDEGLSIKSEYINAVIDGLAYNLALNHDDNSEAFERKIQRLERNYESRKQQAHHADRERASFRIRLR